MVELAMRSPFGNAEVVLELRVPNAPRSLHKGHSLLLTLVKPQLPHNVVRQPIPPQCNYEMRSVLLEVGFRKASFPAVVNHIGGSGPGLLNVLHSK